MSRTSPSWSTARHRYFRCPRDGHEEFVQIPGVAHPTAAAPQSPRVVESERLTPLSNRFIRHGDLSQHHFASAIRLASAAFSHHTRKGVPNPFKPGELMDVAAKPATTKVKVRALKNLKDMV